MDYDDLKSKVGATKRQFTLQSPSESFLVVPERPTPYIEPEFERADFPIERPAVVLISAIGATGKTSLAKALSNDTGLPLLNLAAHKPVGDNTLTGLLHNTFQIRDLSDVFEGIAQGTYGIIIDAIDEGRSKTTEQAFEAFLDDVAGLAGSSPNTSFVLLARSRILEDCWAYLSDKGVTTGLITLSPFDLDRAQRYIDANVKPPSAFHRQYEAARDHVLSLLGSTFSSEKRVGESSFLAFIGYPPVLDAIGTLLKEERDYNRLLGVLAREGSQDVEIRLLRRITSLILERERVQKVTPNILGPLVQDLPNSVRGAALAAAYDEEEQCLRVLSYCLGRTVHLMRIADASINNTYEERLLPWIPDHPFLHEDKFRNTIFESYALATLMTSTDPQAAELVLTYAYSHKHTYHLVYLLHDLANGRAIPIQFLNFLIGSSLEFWTRNASVDLYIEGAEQGSDNGEPHGSSVEIEIEITTDGDSASSKSFSFRSNLIGNNTVDVGSRLARTFISLPSEVRLSSADEIQFIPPVEISATKIHLDSKSLVVKHYANGDPDDGVRLAAGKIESSLSTITTHGVNLRFSVPTKAGLTHPVIQFASEDLLPGSDEGLREKYMRLRRILVEFRSHSRGALARYAKKIENERVLRNQVGRRILKRLVDDQILVLDGDRYFLQPEKVHTHLAVSWPDLRRGAMSASMIEYLRSID